MIQDLLKRAAQIRDEDRDRHNTALRVGRLFIDIIQAQQHLDESLGDFSSEVARWRWLQIQRGEWSEATAKGDDPYRFTERAMTAPDGVHQYNQVVQHVVYRHALKWGCIADKTTRPPEFDCRDWVLLDDYPGFSLSIDSDAGTAFRPRQVDTHLTISVYDHDRDITQMIRSTPGAAIEWFRQTANTAEDGAWKPKYDPDDDLWRIHITTSDMGTNWIYGYRQVCFVCRVTIPAGAEFRQYEATFTIK